MNYDDAPIGTRLWRVECLACGHVGQLPYAASKGRVADALYGSLRCTWCGTLGDAAIARLSDLSSPDAGGEGLPAAAGRRFHGGRSRPAR